MSDITLFNFRENPIRTFQKNGQPYFVAIDVAKALGYKKPRNAIARHCEDAAPLEGVMDNKGRLQSNIIIPESDMYALVFGSELEEAKAFRRWVTKEVLPTIRQTGGYTREAYLKLEEDRDKFKYLYHTTEDMMEKKSMYKR